MYWTACTCCLTLKARWFYTFGENPSKKCSDCCTHKHKWDYWDENVFGVNWLPVLTASSSKEICPREIKLYHLTVLQNPSSLWAHNYHFGKCAVISCKVFISACARCVPNCDAKGWSSLRKLSSTPLHTDLHLEAKSPHSGVRHYVHRHNLHRQSQNSFITKYVFASKQWWNSTSFT